MLEDNEGTAQRENTTLKKGSQMILILNGIKILTPTRIHSFIFIKYIKTIEAEICHILRIFLE